MTEEEGSPRSLATPGANAPSGVQSQLEGEPGNREPGRDREHAGLWLRAGECCLATGEMLAVWGTRHQPASPRLDSAEGEAAAGDRKRAAAAAHACTASPPPTTHTRTRRRRRLPPPPAGFLPLPSRCCSGLLRSRFPRASDPASTRGPFAIPPPRLLAARQPPSPRLLLPPTPLQLLATPLRAPAAPARTPPPAPPPVPPRLPAPRARTNQPLRPRPSPPLSAPGASSVSASRRAGLCAPRPPGWGSGAPAPPTFPETALAFRPQPRGCPGRQDGALPPLRSALALRARGWPTAGRLPDQRRRNAGRARLSSDLPGGWLCP